MYPVKDEKGRPGIGLNVALEGPVVMSQCAGPPAWPAKQHVALEARSRDGRMVYQTGVGATLRHGCGLEGVSCIQSRGTCCKQP